LIDTFDDIASSLSDVVSGTTRLYRGITQAQMVRALFMGLLTGEPVLFVGEHASMKSSLCDFAARIFDKPAVHVRESFQNPADLEAWSADISAKLELDSETFTRNLVDGIDVEYSEYSGKVHCSVAIDAAKHPKAAQLGEPVREPIWYFSRQLTDQDQPEDILGFVIEHPALLGNRPPHLVKKGRLTGSDFAFLDEIFASPLLLAHLHRALNEKVYDTTIGQAQFRALGIVAASNPWNDYYPTNPKLASIATLDRYAFSVRCIAPSSQQILSMATTRMKGTQKVPIELVYEARKLLDEVVIPEELLGFTVALTAHLSRCYFSTSKTERRTEAASPFEIQHDCGLCVFSDNPCSIANVTRTRTILNTVKGMRALALLSGRKEANKEDLVEVLQMVLAYRAYWNNQDFLVQSGGPHLAVKELLRRFGRSVATRGTAFKEVEKLLASPDAALALQLRNKYTDDVIVRSFIDEVLDMMKESAKKKGDAKTLSALSDEVDLTTALAIFSPATKQAKHR
jgi:MoxR-like ATPase